MTLFPQFLIWFLRLILNCADTGVDGDDAGKSGGLVSGDVFMVFQFCEYDLYGLLKNVDVVSMPFMSNVGCV